jgi:phospholipid-binding lipoprotein MlaA
MKRWLRNLAMAMLLCGAAGCATVGSDPRDPLEPFNRAMYAFNDGFDEILGKPIATAYRDVLPNPARMMVRNFFANIEDAWIGINNLLQGKPLDALTDWTRFAMNSTMGLLGLMDFASEVGLEKHDEDFGQTMGRWGAEDGAYFVWPFFGSSTMRDTIGMAVDITVDPVWQHDPKGVRRFMIATRGISKRADLLDASRILEEAALDKYVFQRDAYLQRRRSQIYDGSPPRADRLLSRPAAEEPTPAAPAAAPAAPALRSAAPGAFEAAARLLESPASPTHAHGG